MRRVDVIKQKVCTYFEINSIHMVGRSRAWRYSRPRQVAMFLCDRHTDMSLSAIAVEFNKDHTTVLHAVRKVTEMIMGGNHEIRDNVEEIERMLPWMKE